MEALHCFDVVADLRLIYINLHVQSKTLNSKYRKSNHSISAARQAGGAARFRRGLSRQTVVATGLGGGAEGSRREKRHLF